ncbi:MAG TPA: SpoVG family protein [Candidatus Omnitrophota bacterium]|nr:SpoVG family protein [Candidatus Omnitrophota bacterium]HPT06815.1 SpoVG family protein [Candidatus Omnitrophota bacterium]
MEQESALKVVRMHRFSGESKTKAFVDVSLGDFIVRGLRIVEGKNGLFLSMPQEKSKEGKWFNLFYAATKEAKQVLSNVVLSAYEQ